MQGQQTQTDHTANFFWLIALFAGALIALWFFEKKYILLLVFWMRYGEVEVIRILADIWFPVAKFLHLPLPNLQKLDAMKTLLKGVILHPTDMTWQNFAEINTEIGNWVRYFVILVLAGLAALVYFHFGASRFRNAYDMNKLRAVGQENWPQITPVISLNLAKMDIDVGPWAMAQLPLQFCKANSLLLLKMVDNKKTWGLKQKPAYRLFALQLGPLWQGLDRLPIHVKALALVFLARATGQRPLSKSILSQIATSAASGKLDFSGVSEQLVSFRDHRIVQWAEKRHKYVTTMMATLLEIARSDGVLASAEFLWLKPVDRRLWYVLNTIGRRTAVVEAAGVYAHWIAEKRLGRGMKTPMVKSAVDALEEMLSNVLYVDEVEQWRTSSAD